MYIALKDLNLSGVRYMAGEGIPKEAVVPSRAAALIRSGYIARHEDDSGCHGAGADHAKGIPVHLKKSGEDIYLHPDEVAAVFLILQENAEDAAVTLAEQDSRNVLEVVRELDSRKGVRAAAEAFLKGLEEPEEVSGSEENADDSEENADETDTGQQKEAVG